MIAGVEIAADQHATSVWTAPAGEVAAARAGETHF
jgi:hypothetical protein